MIILLKNKQTLKVDDFMLNVSIGKNGRTKNKTEGDKKTPREIFQLEIYFRSDRLNIPYTKLKTVVIKKLDGWCDDLNFPEKYNKLIKINKKLNMKNFSKRS